MIKVLNVIDGVGWCGTKEQTYLITKYLQREGVESHLALAFEHEEMVSKLRGEVELRFYERYRGGISRFNPMNLKRLKDIIESGDYDVLIAHSSHAFDYVRAVYPFLREKPRVVALRRSGYIPNAISKWLKYSVADRIVVVSKEVARQLREANFYPEKLRVIESGIELSRFYPRPELYPKVRGALGVKEGELLLMNVANWQPWRKGQEVLLDALRRLKEVNFKMVFVGRGTESQDALDTYKRYGLEDRCLGLGFREDVHELLQGADLFILPSFSEGIAGALLQAMACGRVVVATAAGGIPEYLQDSRNGFLSPVGDPKALADKISKALSLNEKSRRELTAEAIATAREFSIDRTVQKYAELLRELVP